MKSLSALIALALLALGCGIPEAVGNECGPYERAYALYQNKQQGLAMRGVDPNAPIVRNTQAQVAQARARAIECRGDSI